MLRFASSGGTFEVMPVARSTSWSSRPSGNVSALMESLLSTRSTSGPLTWASAPKLVNEMKIKTARHRFIALTLDFIRHLRLYLGSFCAAAKQNNRDRLEQNF